jgi:DNA-directed RNA polymerase specialized sigma24 family protein
MITMATSELEQDADIETADSATSVAQALARLTDTDLLRLHALARLRSRGLPAEVGWTDLLHEAIVRALDGSRRWPAEVPLLGFLSGVMRSLRDEIWRRRAREAEWIVSGDDVASRAVACPAPDQERALVAMEMVGALHQLFASDGTALRIIAGLENGFSAEEIRATHNLSTVEYDSARRRMRRALLRVGLSWSAP